MEQQNKQWGKIVLSAVVAIAIIGGAVFYANKNQSKIADKNTGATVVGTPEIKPIGYKGEDGKDALALLKQNAQIETKEYEGLGELVTSINGVENSEDGFWSFYVNGEPAQTGAKNYLTKSTDQIEWKYEKIQ